jgi:hypothetical protein
VSGTGIVVTTPRSGHIGNDRAGGRADQSTRNRGTCRSACETSDQRARTAADERTAEYAVLARVRASSKCQRHHGEQYDPAHAIPPSRFFDRKKLPSMYVKFAAAHQFTVHVPEVSKSSFHTYISLLPLTIE